MIRGSNGQNKQILIFFNYICLFQPFYVEDISFYFGIWTACIDIMIGIVSGNVLANLFFDLGQAFLRHFLFWLNHVV